MNCENVMLEWKECRETIARFDQYLLKLRLLGFSIFTLLFTVITGAAGSKDAVSSFKPEALLFAVITLSLFVLAIYILDRYYERMLLVAVFRASYLEAYRLEGFRIGLTTEIEFQKEKLMKRSFKTTFFKASHMVNFVYALIFITMWIEYIALSTRVTNNLTYCLILLLMATIVSGIALIAHALLKEPLTLISSRSKVVNSPVVMSRQEIKHTVKKVAHEVIEWLKRESCEELHIVSILFGARQFTDDLVMHLKEHGIKTAIHFIRIVATHDDKLIETRQHIHGILEKSVLENKMVLIVDDILDKGRTLNEAKEIALRAGAKCVKAAALLNKYDDCPVTSDFLGCNLGLSREKLRSMDIDDYWLFGYGMDLDGQYRDIEHIGWIEKKLSY